MEGLLGKRISTVAVGESHVLAATADDELFGWGLNDRGQITPNTLTFGGNGNASVGVSHNFGGGTPSGTLHPDLADAVVVLPITLGKSGTKVKSSSGGKLRKYFLVQILTLFYRVSPG